MSKQPDNPERGIVYAYHIGGRVTSLPIGTQIVGFNSYRDLDTYLLGPIRRNIAAATGGHVLLHNYRGIGRGIGGTFHGILGHDLYLDYSDNKTLSGYIEQQFRKKRFNGRVVNVSATVIPPDRTGIPHERFFSSDSVFSFLSSLELSSTGRGIIGSFVTESTVFYSPTPTYPGTRAIIRQLTGSKGADVLEDLLRSANTEWAIGQLEALSRTISAGLPTLGKRR